MNTLREYLPWLLSAITIWMTVLAGNQHPRAWLVGLANQALWLAWIIAAGAWGLLPMNAALCGVYARNHWRWKKTARPQLVDRPLPTCHQSCVQDGIPGGLVGVFPAGGADVERCAFGRNDLHDALPHASPLSLPGSREVQGVVATDHVVHGASIGRACDKHKASLLLSCADMADLLRLDEVFSDDESYDIPKERMKRLAELGVVRWHGRDIYSITAFGRLCLGEETAVLPLETPHEYNARMRKDMEARNA